MRKLTIVLMFLAVSTPVVASEEDDVTSLSYISYLERYATVQPSSEDEGIEAVINMPLVPGDRVDTAREARMEIFLADGNSLWLDEYTTLSLDAVAFSRDTGGDRTVLFLADGTIVVEVSEHSLSTQPIRIDGRSATVYLNGEGLYRVEAQSDGGLRLEVWKGLAEAATSAGGIQVTAETTAVVAAGQISNQDTTLTWGDDFAGWVGQRRQIVQGESGKHVEARYERQAGQLDNYGNWIYLSESDSWAWQPTVSAGWRPYTAGRWYSTPTGYSWLSYEPWGWLPYHYGSWNCHATYGWVWSWHSVWSPAWVRWAWWPGYVGWCPWGYYASWWGPRYGHHYPTHPIAPGGGHQPPRRDVVPHSTSRIAVDEGQAGTSAGRGLDPTIDSDGSTLATAKPAADGATVRTAARHQPAGVAFDMNGRADIGAIDHTGWSVVADRDFAKPQQSRFVQSGEVAMRGRDGQEAIIMSGPLVPSSRTGAKPAGEIEQVFQNVRRQSPNDLSPVLASAMESFRGVDAMALVPPALAPSEMPRHHQPQPETAKPTLSASAGSPMYTAPPYDSGSDAGSERLRARRGHLVIDAARPAPEPESSRAAERTLKLPQPLRRAVQTVDPGGPHESPNSGVRAAPSAGTRGSSPSDSATAPTTGARPSGSGKADSGQPIAVDDDRRSAGHAANHVEAAGRGAQQPDVTARPPPNELGQSSSDDHATAVVHRLAQPIDTTDLEALPTQLGHAFAVELLAAELTECESAIEAVAAKLAEHESAQLESWVPSVVGSPLFGGVQSVIGRVFAELPGRVPQGGSGNSVPEEPIIGLVIR